MRQATHEEHDMTEAKPRPAPWSDTENAALVALYFVMLDSAIAGRAYNKAGMIREHQGEAPNTSPTTGIENAVHSAISMRAELGNRSKQSIEFKLMNATAAHLDASDGVGGYVTTMDGYGYRAMPNYQASLKDAMREALVSRPQYNRQASL